MARKGSRTAKREAEKSAPPKFTGWISTDEQEIERRRWRGRTEIASVSPVGDLGLYGDYKVESSSGGTYLVEIRSLKERINSCQCADFRTNGLSTCKHVEGALHALRGANYRPEVAAAGPRSGRIEVYLDEREPARPCVSAPPSGGEPPPGFEDLARSLSRGSARALKGLRVLADENPDRIRVSRRLDAWMEALQGPKRRRQRRARYEADLRSGRRGLGMLKRQLYPYQLQGALHLAFGERVMLADDMGLGKTVQAIAACAIVRDLGRAARVLVVSPASLKSEWAEQIRLFTDFEFQIILGGADARRKMYRRAPFFSLSNYEQIRMDLRAIEEELRPDIIVLDEAQRIKNWHTKTAGAIKMLRSPYAFVLTGTPLENRIDEVYSIFQFLDPTILGPLFRFNRDYYELDEKGRASGLRNLDRLADRIAPHMLRRRKEDVEQDLPGRTTKTFFVPMTELQKESYADYEFKVRRLAKIAEKRPLSEDEFKILQMNLACMRMTCDATYILDQEVRESPKIDELERLLPDLFADPERKIIVFSEWVRMLELVRECVQENGIDYVWHTGKVPQKKRREEINRFRRDPACRAFLSSDSGGVGLNLQVADTVINMDQPWNPARVEQRVARAWRKHQTRTVNVFNFVTEHSIEHRMLYLQAAKALLAEGVIDRRGDVSKIELPSGRTAFLERLREVLGEVVGADAVPAQRSPAERLRDEVQPAYGARLRRILASKESGAVLVVADVAAERIADEERRLGESCGAAVTVIRPDVYEAMLRLAAAGMVTMPTNGHDEVYPKGEAPPPADDRRIRTGPLVDGAQRKLKAAALLRGGGFAEEAAGPAGEAAFLAARALAVARREPEPGDSEAAAAYLLGLPPEAGISVEGAVGALSGEAEGDEAVNAAQALLDRTSEVIGGLPG